MAEENDSGTGVDDFEAAVAMLDEDGSGQSAEEPAGQQDAADAAEAAEAAEPAEPAEAAEPAEDGGDPEPAPRGLWGAIAKKREEGRPPPEEKPAPEAPDLKALEEAVRQRVLAEFERDPAGYYERHNLDSEKAIERLTSFTLDRRKAEGGDRLAALEKRLEEMQASKESEAEAAQKFQQQQLQQQQAQQAVRRFNELSGNTEKYKYLGALPENMRQDFGVMFAVALQNHGAIHTEEETAQIVDETFGELFKLWSGSQQGETEQQGEQKTKVKPTTIGNADAALTSGKKPPTTEEDRIADAIAYLDAQAS